MTPSQYLTERLATEVLSFSSQSLLEAVAKKASDCILDSLACALAGSDLAPTRIALEVAMANLAPGTTPVWFTGLRMSPAGASWCNSMAASCLDYDDGHRLARGHPGAAIVPAVLAQADKNNSTSAEILTAIAIGYEVAIATAAAQRYERIQTYQSGRWVGMGVVAACGRLAGLSVDQLAQALAIAGVWAPNQLANGSSGYAMDTGNWAKEGIAIAAFQGLMAVDLGQRGFTGPLDLLDHKTHYLYSDHPERLWAPDLILDTYFKRYACCRYIHAALDACCRLLKTSTIEAEDIARIEVDTFSWALQLSNKVAPSNLVEAQYSLPFCVAALLIHGEQAISPMDEALLIDPRITALARKISVRGNPLFDRQFPQRTLAQITITDLSGGHFESEPAVEPAALARENIRAKFLRSARGRLGESVAHDILQSLDTRQTDITLLLDLLGRVRAH